MLDALELDAPGKSRPTQPKIAWVYVGFASSPDEKCPRLRWMCPLQTSVTVTLDPHRKGCWSRDVVEPSMGVPLSHPCCFRIFSWIFHSKHKPSRYLGGRPKAHQVPERHINCISKKSFQERHCIGLLLIYGKPTKKHLPSMDWIKGKFTGRAPYLMGKSMVSCRFSLKPIHWYQVWSQSYRFVPMSAYGSPGWDDVYA